jgi:ArsR family transcriptional regulator, arsenate/arsenite/antimonite-responsive transcriptional repressor
MLFEPMHSGTSHAAPHTACVFDEAKLCPVFRALADPTRLWFLDVLQHGEARLDKLRELSTLSTGTVIHHLGVLVQAGLLTTWKEGPMRLYAFRPEGFTGAARRLQRFVTPRGPPYQDADFR